MKTKIEKLNKVAQKLHKELLKCGVSYLMKYSVSQEAKEALLITTLLNGQGDECMPAFIFDGDGSGEVFEAMMKNCLRHASKLNEVKNEQ